MELKIGSTGENVIKLQTKLGLKADGQFGPITESKVKEYQTKNGLKSTGIVDLTMWNKLFPTTTTTTTTSNLNFDKLNGVVPENVINEIKQNHQKFNLTTNLRLAHFLAQCAHESASFKLVKENLNYSADGLLKTFPKYFNQQNVNEYARKPEKIASRVYANRMENGDEASKEGAKFIGRGYIQLTGKANYKEFGKFIGEDTISNPDIVSTKYPLSSALFFFNKNNLWSICDKGSTEANVKEITKRVNGGTIGLEDRIKYFNKYWNILK